MKKILTLIIDKSVLAKHPMGLSTEVVIRKKPELDDKEAINAFIAVTKADGTIVEELVGYIANKTSSIIEGTMPATQIGSDFVAVAGARVLTMEGIVNGECYYTAEFVKTEVEVKDKKEFSFILSGGLTTYPGKSKLTADTKVRSRDVKIVLLDGKLIGEYEGIPAGIVRADEEVSAILVQFCEDLPDVIAKSTSVDKGNILCTLSISAVVATRHEALADVINRVLEEGIETQEALDEKLDYLRKCKVSEIAIASLFESYVKYPDNVKGRIPSKPKTLYIDTEGMVASIIPYYNIGKHLAFEGDKAVGKNVMAETLGWLYARPIYEYSFNSQQSNNSLLGAKTFADNKEDDATEKKEVMESLFILTSLLNKAGTEGGNTEMAEAELEKAQKAYYKGLGSKDQALVFEMSSVLEAAAYGGQLVADEFNTAQASILSIFNAMLDDRRRIEVTGLGVIQAHKNFIVISTQNRDYEGTFEANEATRDRFEPVLFPALSGISGVLQERVPGVAYETVLECNKLYLGLKSAVDSGSMSSQVLSLRGFVSACEVLAQGVPLKNALTNSVANRISDVDERRAVIEMISCQLG